VDFANGHRRRISHTGEFGLSVLKKWRGQGIGEILLSALLDWARSVPDLEKINLLVHATNDRAIALYRKFGFEVEGRRKKDLKLGPGEYVDSVLMGLWIK
jgi:RimJ/RimL family protein N-acetyltransferase